MFNDKDFEVCEFERSTDYVLLTSLLVNPSLYPFMTDDFSLPVEEVAAIEHPGLWYILARYEGHLLGFFLCEPRSTILFEFHTVMPLDRRALAAMRALLGPDGWLWGNSPCLRAVTYVPACNTIAHRFGLRAGLIEFGRNPDSLLKNHRLQDQILMGTSKPKDTMPTLTTTKDADRNEGVQ